MAHGPPTQPAPAPDREHTPTLPPSASLVPERRSTAPLFDDVPTTTVSTVPPPVRLSRAPAAPSAPNVRETLLALGELVDDRYEITELLGQGGMGRVYAANDLVLGRVVAVKVAVDPSLDEQLEREARALAPLRHPSLAAVHGTGRHAGRAYLVTERLTGITLQHRLDELSRRDLPMPLAEALDLLGAIAEGLSVLHRAGLAHLDLKPANVMICGDRVVLIDFGLARPELHYRPGERPRGSPEYVAPEVVRGELEPEAGPLVDLYAFGIIAFEMLTGRTPFTADTIAATLHRHVEEEAPYVRMLRPEVPVSLSELIAELLEKEPHDRPPSAEATLWRLAEIRGHELSGRVTRVLVIDDDAVAGDVLKRSLERSMPQLRVVAMADPTAALAHLDELHPGIVAVDLNMPEINGVEFVMSILAMPAERRPVVVAMSAEAQPSDVALLRRLGVQEFVPKDRRFLTTMCDVIGDLRRAAPAP